MSGRELESKTWRKKTGAKALIEEKRRKTVDEQDTVETTELKWEEQQELNEINAFRGNCSIVIPNALKFYKNSTVNIFININE